MSFYTFKNSRLLLNGKHLLVNDCALGVEASLSPLYLSEERHSRTYAPDSIINGGCSFNYYLTGTDPLKNYLTDETTVISGNIGGLFFKSGYLQSYSLSFSPNSPASVAANIVFFDELKGNFTPNYDVATGISSLNTADISISDPTNQNIGNVTNLNSLRYSFSSEITPLVIEETTRPNGVRFGVKELQLELETDNLSGDLPVSGKTAGLSLSLYGPNGLGETYAISGKLFKRDLSFVVNDVIKSRLTIKQNYVDNNPIITGFSPSVGVVNTSVLISGLYFTNATNLFFYDSEDTTFTILSDTLISGKVPLNAITGPISVNTFGGRAQSTSNFSVTQGSLIVSGFNPQTGIAFSQVNITGSNFYRISDILFNGVAADFSVITPNLIQADVPYDGSWGKIAVVSDDRGISGLSNELFVPTPQITGFSPSTGVSGITVTILGTSFSGVTGVRFNNLPLAPNSTTFTGLSNTQIIARVPSGNTNGFIRVLGQSGTYGLSLTEFGPIAEITGISPTSGFVGTNIEILGNNFLESLLFPVGPNQYQVSFNGGTGAFDRVNSNRLTGIVPSGATSGKVYIYSNDYELYPSNVVFTLRTSPPIVTNISPLSGKLNDIMIVNGSNFLNLNTVLISGAGGYTNIPAFTGNSLGTTLTFALPNVSKGVYDVIVGNIAGSGTGIDLFTVLKPPFISGFTPTSGAFGNSITVTGENLYPFSTVYFTGIPTEATVTTQNFNASYSSFEFLVPNVDDSVFSGLISINNTVSGHTGLSYLTIIKPPFISGFRPSSGDYGNTIELSGRFLNNTTGVKIGDFGASFSTISSTGLYFTIPEGSITDYVKLFSPAGLTQSPNQLIVQTPFITISGFTPTGIRYGQTLNISGNRLNTAYELRFSGTNQELVYDNTEFTTIGSTGIQFVVQSPIQDGRIKLVNVRGTTQSAQSLFIIPNPIINTITPDYGVFNDLITISGSGFAGYSFFFFGATGDYIAPLTTSIVDNTGAFLRVSRELKPGPIVISGDGLILSFSSGNFIPVPTISGFLPTGIETGQILSLTGINAYSVGTGFLGITGVNPNNVFNISSQLFVNTLRIDGGNTATGFTVITGRINTNFFATGITGVTGKMFLTPSVYGINSAGDYYNSPIVGITNRMLSETIRISGQTESSSGGTQAGSVQLNSGISFVNNTSVGSSTLVFLTYQVPVVNQYSGWPGQLYAVVNPGSGFVIKSTSAGDDNLVAWHFQ